MLSIRRGTAVAAVLVGAAAGVASAQGTLPVTARAITGTMTYDASPSPDGKRLVYIAAVGGHEQLQVSGVNGERPVQITRDLADHEDPAWSPDGQWIAYVLSTPGHEVIHRMRPDGTGDEALTGPDVPAIHPSWSRDSKQVLYCTDDDLHPPAKNASEIYALDLATRKTTTVISGGTNTYQSVSPDGRSILFRRMIGQKDSEVFLAGRDGQHATNLTANPAFDGWADWSPDGSLIAFGSNRDGSAANWRIYVMHPDGRGVRLVANTVGRATAPHWSPDGRTIYFSNCASGSDCHVMAATLPAGLR